MSTIHCKQSLELDDLQVMCFGDPSIPAIRTKNRYFFGLDYFSLLTPGGLITVCQLFEESF